jgi:two-component system, NtrC family, nitrogen regulation sensor histidine kinase GlnL
MAKAKPVQKFITAETPSEAAMLAALPDAVLGFDADLLIFFSNHAAQAFFGLGEKQLAGKSLTDLFSGVVIDAAEGILRKSMTATLHDVTVNGKEAGSITVSAVQEGQSYLIVLRPQRSQIASVWSEKNKYSLQSAERVAQMLAHEIKNPLAGIRGAAQLLAKSKLDAADRELASLIARETLRIQALADKFNIFHEVPQSLYTSVNLHEVLKQAIGVVRAAHGADIEISEKFDPSLPDVHGHFDHLVQAVLNLIKNAAEAFGGKKGSILIRTHFDTAAPFHPERPEKLPICIEIEDNGHGIMPEALSQIFQPYFTTKPNGQGLGLSIVARIADNHGGIIRASSVPGKTVFKLNLPMRRA